MPDHVHLFAMPGVKPDSMQKWIAQWKSISARRFTGMLGVHAPIWQRDYFDRYLRTAESYQTKWNYVRNNPIRANLVTAPEHWPYQGEIHELRK
jgi:REP element-mobilizing transposase RayT